jgi:hypothetical protein
MHWKEQNVPVLYDWLSHRNLEWPSSSARWGPVLKVRAPTHRGVRGLGRRAGHQRRLSIRPV